MIELVMVIAAGTASVVLPLGAWMGVALTRKKMRPSPRLKPDLCTGYITEDCRDPKVKTDCEALRSVTCLDGRCTYHCKKMCNCDLPSG